MLPANTAVCSAECVLQRRRKPNLSSIHHGKIGLHLLIIAFFRLKGRRLNRQSCNMRDAAVAAINFSLSLMKGLIRQQISRLPFKCQASIQLDASGRKAARVEQNGTMYNQSHKSHSSAQPGVTSSGSLYCCGTRGTLNQLLFDDFLGGASPPCHLHPLPFPPSRSRAVLPARPPPEQTYPRLLPEIFKLDGRECLLPIDS